MVKARNNWKDWQGECDVKRLVFLDETGLSTDRIRRYGPHWAVRVVRTLRLLAIGKP